MNSQAAGRSVASMQLAWVLLACFAAVAVAGAEDVSNPVFASRKLTLVGTVLQTADEAVVHAQANKVRGLKSQLNAEVASVADISRARLAVVDAFLGLGDRVQKLRDQIAAEKDDGRHDAMVFTLNETLRELDKKSQQADTLARKQGQVPDVLPAYSDALDAAFAVGAAALSRYEDLAKDEELAKQVTAFNHTAAHPIALGPSPACVADLKFLKKCDEELELEAIPVRLDGGVPNVDVRINGQTFPMIWDSGATYLSISAETAKALGLEQSEKSTFTTVTVADGKQVKVRQETVPEVRVGNLIAKDVVCAIGPSGSPDLLGNAFQGHFLFRLDQQAHLLRMIPLDKTVSVASDAVALVPRERHVAPQTPTASAPDPHQPPAEPEVDDGQDPIAAHQLIKGGNFLVLAAEAQAHADCSAVRAWKARVVSEALARANFRREYDTATREYDVLVAKLVDLKSRLKSLEGNPSQYNQLVDPYNQTLEESKQQYQRVKQFEERRKGGDSRAEYADALVSALRNANSAADRYAACAASKRLLAAVEKLNSGSARPIKLGPSGSFTADLTFLRKSATDLANEGVPLLFSSGDVPVVAVSINGKTKPMMWDSGASTVLLTSDVAAEMGLHATDEDPTITSQLADGSTVNCKIVTAPEVRVGAFIARDVACAIIPSTGQKTEMLLLGDTFQKHFVARMDRQAGVLHLTPKDRDALSAADARPLSGQPAAAVEPPKSISSTGSRPH